MNGSTPGLLLLALPAALYAAAVVRLRGRGDTWQRSRSLCAALALVCAAGALAPPVAARAERFDVHVGQHLVLAMLVPLLLACSAPVTLALRVLPVRSRRRLLAALHSRPVRTLSTPAVVLLLHVGSLYAAYLPVLGGPLLAAHGHDHVHVLVHLHMVATGCLLSWYVVGLDPIRRTGGVGAQLVVLLGAAAAHDVLAKLLYASPPVWAGPAHEVRRGAELMFYGGEGLEVLFAVVLLSDWYARRGRALRRAAPTVTEQAATTIAACSRGLRAGDGRCLRCSPCACSSATTPTPSAP